ncbi:MAG: sigma-70 family RNA polymerase sigma factor [Bacteroidota bacterium]
MNFPFRRSRVTADASDEALAQAFRQTGKTVYFNRLFERYYPLVFARCLSLTAQRENSKDLTLTIFTKAHHEWQSRQVENVRQWLFTLTKNECLNFLRLQKGRRRVQQRWWEEHAPPVWLENEYFRRQFYEEQLAQDELFQRALEQLSEEQRRCLTLFTWELKSYQAIADELAMEVSQVKSHLQNARRRLKKWVAEQLSTRNEE